MSAAASASAPRTLQFDALTGLRFVAAFHVVLFHYWAGLLHDKVPWINAIVSSGYVAVGLFYVLSGFILTVVYGSSDLDRAGRRRFWGARVARVYPAYFLAALLWIPVVLLKHPPAIDFLALGPTLLGVQAWVPSLATAWNFPAWSVSVEAFFYLVFPFVLPYVRRLTFSQTWRFLAMTYALGLVAPALHLALNTDPASGQLWSTDVWTSVIKFNPLIRFPEFLAGMGVGQLFRLRGSRPVPSWYALAAALTLLAILTRSRRIEYLFIHNGTFVPLFGVLVFGLATAGGKLGALLSQRHVVVLGEASYSLYILQAPVRDLALYLTSLCGITNPWLNFQKPLMVVMLLVPVSVLVLYRVEMPTRHWLRKVLAS